MVFEATLITVQVAIRAIQRGVVDRIRKATRLFAVLLTSSVGALAGRTREDLFA